MRTTRLVGLLAVAPLAGLAACSSSTPQVTDQEAAAFKTQVVQQVPYMARFTEQNDFTSLDRSICSSLKQGQSYGNVSDTVGATIIKPASDASVDGVIKVAVDTSCPEQKDAVPGL